MIPKDPPPEEQPADSKTAQDSEEFNEEIHQRYSDYGRGINLLRKQTMTPKIPLQRNNLLRKQKMIPKDTPLEEQPAEKTDNDLKDTPPEEQPTEKTDNDTQRYSSRGKTY